MAKRELECLGKCGSTLTVYADNVTAHICRRCTTPPPRGSLLCDLCGERTVAADTANVKAVTCSSCTQRDLTRRREVDRLDRSEVTGEMIREAMKKSGWNTYKLASLHLMKRDRNLTASRLGRNVRGDISPPDRSLVDWVREVMPDAEAPVPKDKPKAKPKTVQMVGHDDAADKIVAWLTKQTGRHSRSQILNAVPMDVSVWNQAIKDLVESGRVTRTGQKKGTKYEA